MNSPDVNRLFFCFADLESSGTPGHTHKAFIFSLENNEALPPFKCLAKDKKNAIYKGSSRGPSFGKGPYFTIFGSGSATRSMAAIYTPYIAPTEVHNTNSVLAGTAKRFSPDNYEVFYLA